MNLQSKSPRLFMPPICPPSRQHDDSSLHCTLVTLVYENILGTITKLPRVLNYRYRFLSSSRASLSSSAAFRHFQRPQPGHSRNNRLCPQVSRSYMHVHPRMGTKLASRSANRTSQSHVWGIPGGPTQHSPCGRVMLMIRGYIIFSLT